MHCFHERRLCSATDIHKHERMEPLQVSVHRLVGSHEGWSTSRVHKLVGFRCVPCFAQQLLAEYQLFAYCNRMLDNVEIGMNMLGKQNALIHWLNHLRWANILHFLGAILALAFSVVWEQGWMACGMIAARLDSGEASLVWLCASTWVDGGFIALRLLSNRALASSIWITCAS
eukprot:1147333-Pelagomonas_calceolata.AAC.4